MNNIENDIIDNINSIIYQRYSNGIKALSSKKVLNYIKKKFNISLDDNALGDILKDNPHIDGIDNDKILLVGHKKEDDAEQADKDVHDMAVNQAGSNMMGDGMPLGGDLGGSDFDSGMSDTDFSGDESSDTSLGGEPSLDSSESSEESNTIDSKELSDVDLGDVDLSGLKQESVFNAFKSLTVGTEIDSNNVLLEESNLYYHLHNGVKKSKGKYIVCDVIPHANLMESVIRCKVKDSAMIIDIPLQNLQSKK